MSEKLTKNQQTFIEDAVRQGLEVDLEYSGRGMYGKTCPSVDIRCESEFETKAKTRTDSMGLGLVVYAQQ